MVGVCWIEKQSEDGGHTDKTMDKIRYWRFNQEKLDFLMDAFRDIISHKMIWRWYETYNII